MFFIDPKTSSAEMSPTISSTDLGTDDIGAEVFSSASHECTKELGSVSLSFLQLELHTAQNEAIL